MRHPIVTNKVNCLIVIAIFFCGCNITTQSFNHGKLLNPGEGMITSGLGYKNRLVVERGYRGSYQDGMYVETYTYDTLPLNWLGVGFDFRLGFLEKYPFGKGMEIGFHVEGAFTKELQETYSFYGSGSEMKYVTVPEGPPVVELSGRFGLPAFIRGQGIYHHNIEAGWIVGGWVDNGVFAGYCAGLELENKIPYASLRLVFTPTDIYNDTRDVEWEDFFSESKQHITMRTTLGCSFKIKRIPVLPDFISPEICILGPNFTEYRSFGFGINIGLRWMNGI